MDRKRLFSLTVCWIFAIVPGLCVLSYADNKSQTNPEAEQHFQKANELQILADCNAAIAEYQAVISSSPNSKIAQNAQYWIGQLYFESKQFDAALSAFQKLLDEYPESKSIPATKQMIERVQQAQKNRSLFEAAEKGDTEQVKLLIAEGTDINARDERGMTPLHKAAENGRKEVAELLIAKGADVDVKEDKYGATPLNCAIWGKDKDVAELLIANGANVNSKGHYGWTPLHDAAWHGAKHVAELLLAKKADINAQAEKWAATPLHAAACQGHRDVAELLIAAGADVNRKGIEGYTLLYHAIGNDDPNLVNCLIAHGAKVDTKCPGGETALHYAAATGRTTAVKLLLEAGSDIDAKDDNGRTALHVPLDINSYSGTYRPSKDTIQLLLAKGADVNLKDKAGRTPLHLAVESADGDIVKLLLDKGARVNEKDDESGFTALHHAARFGNKNAAELLIARGADINAKDKQGHTPLQVAVSHDYKVAELLINKGADSGIRAESGRTLLQLAQQRRQIESTVPDLIFDGEPNSWFGLTTVCGDVDGDGYDDVLIGATRYDNNRGRAYLFYGGPDMDATPDLIFEGQNEGDYFGAGIACGDIDNDGHDDIIIGACSYEGQGCAYLYWGGDRNSMDAKPDKIFTGENKKGSRFGYGSNIYDIDNDGYDDIILGAYWYPGDATGRVYLYYGNKKELLDTSYDLIFTAEEAQGRFGYTFSCGDVDNDGYGDMVISSLADQCRAYLYYGANKSNMDAKVDVIFETPSRRYKWGNGLLCVDQNRDGYDDIVIGAPAYNDWQGRAYLFYGNSKGSLDATPDKIFDGEVEGSFYGVREVCGDIDGDKVNDLIIGACGCGQRVGRVYVYWGKDLSAPNPKPGMILTGENPNDEFGVRIACGDVNNDGFDDLIVAAIAYKAGSKQGRVYLYYGGPRKK